MYEHDFNRYIFILFLYQKKKKTNKQYALIEMEQKENIN